MIYIATNARNTLAPHCDKAFVTGIARHLCRLLEVFVPATRGCRISGTYCLDPVHWTLPAVSEADRIVLALTVLLEKLEMMPPRWRNIRHVISDVSATYVP